MKAFDGHNERIPMAMREREGFMMKLRVMLGMLVATAYCRDG